MRFVPCFFLFSFIFFISTPVSARIDDTNQQSIERYGEPLWKNTAFGAFQEARFQNYEYDIHVRYQNNKVVFISYVARNKDRLTIVQIERLLRHNGNREGMRPGIQNIWYLTGASANGKEIEFKDNAENTRAVYDIKDHVLSVYKIK